MTSKKLIARLAAAGTFAFALTMGACGDIERGETTPPAAAVEAPGGTTEPTDPTDGGDGEATGLSFAADVHTILMAKCSGCHTATHGSAYKLTGDPAADHATVSALVDVGAPDASKILVKGSGNGHGGGPALNAASAEYATVKEWITGGALP